jgi:stress response protein SCP2
VSQRFVKGQKSRLSALTSGTEIYVGIQVDAPGTTWDILCFGLDPAGRLSDDRYFVFFNQPESPDGAVRKLGPQRGDSDSFEVLLDKVPAAIGRFSFCAAIESGGTAAGIHTWSGSRSVRPAMPGAGRWSRTRAA